MKHVLHLNGHRLKQLLHRNGYGEAGARLAAALGAASELAVQRAGRVVAPAAQSAEMLERYHVVLEGFARAVYAAEGVQALVEDAPSEGRAPPGVTSRRHPCERRSRQAPTRPLRPE